jgi:3',5'-nucleoside bisphosphate phosphatase
MSGYIDLHLHSTYSDGLDTPEELLNKARKRKLAAISISDHDNVDGIRVARELLHDNDPELVPGVELSAGRSGEDIHILGYYIDIDSESLNETLSGLREIRNQRGAEMLNKLKDLGINVPPELVRELAGNAAVSRPHVAEAMLRVGAIKSFEMAFVKYIGYDGPAYVPKGNLTPKEAIDLVHDAGGLALLAHPIIANTIQYLDEFVSYGLDGIEVYHAHHNSRTRRRLIEKAHDRSLLMSGGSDYHGRSGHHDMIGDQQVPYEYLTAIKQRIHQENRG